MYDLIYVIKKYNSSRDSYCSSKLHLSFGWTQDAELNDLRTMIEGMRQQSGVNLAQISEAGKLFFSCIFRIHCLMRSALLGNQLTLFAALSVTIR